MEQDDRQPLPGSRAFHAKNAKLKGFLPPQKIIRVSLYLRPKSPRPSPGSVRLKAADFAAAHGASADDITTVQRFAHQFGLDVVAIHLPARRIQLSGNVNAIQQAFGVRLRYMRDADGNRFRTHVGPIRLPKNISQIVVAVLGLNSSPVAKPHFRIRRRGHNSAQTHDWAHLHQKPKARTFTPLDIGQLYGFPQATGQGQCIGIIELGGGYTTQDLTTYFSKLGLQPPEITSNSVAGGQNAPTGKASGPDGEVMLDIEVAGAIAPQAKIAMYFARNTSQGFVDAVTTAIHDTTNTPSVISISWGGPEEKWSAQTRTAMDSAFHDAALLGITVLVACGDDGSNDGWANGKLHVDFPASSPNVVACGGTTLVVGASGKIGRETVWNDGAAGGATGGGVSREFPTPSYQQSTHVPADPIDGHTGRGVPDLAGNADPETGYQVLVDGKNIVIGGTSAVAPLYAGLIARLNELLKSKGRNTAGFINPTLYNQAMVDAGYRDVKRGNNSTGNLANKAYRAAAGWDPASGWGSIAGPTILTALST